MTKAKKRKNKCKRCKSLFIKQKNEKLCLDCTSRCVRCNEMTVLTKGKCKNCINELAGLTEKERKKDYSLIRNYGITVLEYKAILEQQGGVCWICSRPPATLSLSVDHKHEKGERKLDLRLRRNRVRGLACYPCNKALGIMRDNAEAFARAAVYLVEWPAQTILRRSNAD